MKLALSSHITEIDRFCEKKLGISEMELIDRSGEAVAAAVRKMTPFGKKVIFFCGKGNNGADGYAAAVKLLTEYKVTVFDVFGEGQKSDGGKYFMELYRSSGGDLRVLSLDSQTKDEMRSSATIVDAVFGTGFKGELPPIVKELSIAIGEVVGATKIAIDVPIGVNADNGTVDICASTMSATVELSFIKPGIVSYPARSFVGKIIHDTLGLPKEKILAAFDFSYNYVDEDLAASLLPEREENSSKGSFGKALLITGSDKYKGAGALSLEAALRGGVGYVVYCGTESMCDSLYQKFPEAVYKVKPEDNALTYSDIQSIASLSASCSVTLIGSGSDSTEGLTNLVCSLLDCEGGPIVLDADAINALAKNREEGILRIKNAKRPVILTPHPLEFSRLSGMEVAAVQRNRISSAVKFAAENRCILVLKGAGTIVTDGKRVYINGSGSSALAKAGSGDVLAGLIASLAAFSSDPLFASALAVYLHGKGADSALDDLSSYGVTPSDLPIRIAKEIAVLERKKQNM